MAILTNPITQTVTVNTTITGVAGKQYFIRNTSAGPVDITFGSETVPLLAGATLSLGYDGTNWFEPSNILAIEGVSDDVTDLAGALRSTETVYQNAQDIITLQGAISPSGMIAMFGGATAPTGWLMCDGTAVSRTTYADLFTAIGEGFGVGDGSTTFNLPDMRNVVPYGANASARTVATISQPATPLGVSHADRGQGHDHKLWRNGGDASQNAVPPSSTRSFGGMGTASNAYSATAADTTRLINGYAEDVSSNGTPRMGATTMAAGIGVNFIIKT